MIPPEEDDGVALSLTGAIEPKLATKRRRVGPRVTAVLRDDIVDGECIACVSVLPREGARHVDVGRLLNINGDRR
jgi:hypothetical protein